MSETKQKSTETPWTDARIRWTDEDNGKKKNDDDDDQPLDIFASDPKETFNFQYKHGDAIIEIELSGYKADSDEIWESTGLTLWRASHFLCEYLLEHASKLFDSKNHKILELGAGLGLCGILAHRLATKDCQVCVTDGDTDALEQLRRNVETNKKDKTISCHQLLWGRDTATMFLEEHGAFDVLLASDIVYAPIVVEPLWETVQVLLQKPHGVFVLAFARRKVPVSVEHVLSTAEDAGFSYDCVEDDNDGVFVYVFRWKKDEPR